MKRLGWGEPGREGGNEEEARGREEGDMNEEGRRERTRQDGVDEEVNDDKERGKRPERGGDELDKRKRKERNRLNEEVCREVEVEEGEVQRKGEVGKERQEETRK